MKMVIPREHGAWGMLFAPLLVGMFASVLHYNHVLLFLGMLMAYLASFPLIQYLKNPKRNGHMIKWALGYGLIGGVAGLPLLFQFPQLGLLVVPAGIILTINITFAMRKKERHLLNDLAAMSGLSLGGVAAYFVGSQTYDTTAWILWSACLLQFFGSALHVKSLIREKGNRYMKLAANLYHGILFILPLMLSMLMPETFPYKWLSAAYLLSAIKVWSTRFNASQTPMKIGIIEIVNILWFVVVASLVFGLAA